MAAAGQSAASSGARITADARVPCRYFRYPAFARKLISPAPACCRVATADLGSPDRHSAILHRLLRPAYPVSVSSGYCLVTGRQGKRCYYLPVSFFSTLSVISTLSLEYTTPWVRIRSNFCSLRQGNNGLVHILLQLGEHFIAADIQIITKLVLGALQIPPLCKDIAFQLGAF